MADKTPLRLSKFIAHSGVSDRRKAGQLVKDGLIKVNGKVNINPAYRVTEKDIISYKGKVLAIQTQQYYILINKPRSHKYSLSRKPNEKTLGDIIGNKISVPLHLLGYYDNSDLGLIVLSSDEAFITRLLNRKKGIEQQYKVQLDAEFSEDDLVDLKTKMTNDDDIKLSGISLSDDPLFTFNMSLQCSISLNLRAKLKIYGYKVKSMDRIHVAGVSKKNLTRGFFRHLHQNELRHLRYF